MKEIKTAIEFEQSFAQDKPIILDFYTETCNPCKTLQPILEQLSFEFSKSIIFLKTRADQNLELVKDLGVTSVPTVIIVNNQKEIQKANGTITEKALRLKVNDLIGNAK